MQKKPLTVLVDVDVYEALIEVSDFLDKPVDDIVNFALRQYLRRVQKAHRAYGKRYTVRL